MIDVSVIIPAHNAAHFIEGTLKSAQQQTLKTIEILVVDDASTDQTPELVDQIAQADSRVHLISVNPNRGVANARNVGVQAAQGEFVAFLDADDQWLPRKLEQQVSFLHEHHAKFGYGSYELMDAQGQKLGERLITDATLTHKQMLRGNRIGMLTVILDRQVALKHPFPSIHNEDYACWLAIARDGVTAYRCGDSVLARYRKHANSTSANKLQAAQWTWMIYRQVEQMNLFAASVAFIQYAFMAVFDRR
jgi:teichuronic acid biosynthesis glycosyltransferase TuaG